MPARGEAPRAAAPAPAAVRGGDWTLLDVPSPPELEPEASVSVVVEGEPGSEREVAAAVEADGYPRSLVEVLAGADPRPEGEIVVLCPAGIVPEPGWLTAHARWHHLVSDAVSLGPAPPRDADEDPFELVLDLTDLLVDRRGGLFLAAALTTLAVRRDTLLAAGGYGGAELTPALRRLDLAYRLACAGALFVPEPGASARSGAGHAEAALAATIAFAASEERTFELEHPFAAELVPLPPFRPLAAPRRYRRPAAVVNVAAGDAPAEEVAATVAAVLGGSCGDLELRLEIGAAHPARPALEEVAEHDSRLVFGPPSTEERCESPVQVKLPPQALPDRRTVADLVHLLIGEQAGVLHVTVPGAPPDETMIEVISTPALNRARRVAAAGGGEPREVLARLDGERWVSGVEVSVRRHGVEEPHVTEHGPLAAATDLRHERTQHLRFRDRADELAASAAAQEAEAMRERLRVRRERLRARRLEARLADRGRI